MSARRGALPPVEEIVPGCWSMPLPIPNNPLAYVFSYAFETGPGIVLLDAGWNAPETWQALLDGLATVGAALTDVRGILLTHLHADHYGLAGRIKEESGCWTALHPADAALVASRYDEVEPILAAMEDHLRRQGAPAGEVEELRDASLAIRELVVTTPPEVLLEDGDRPDVPGWDLVALHTPGHTPGHLAFTALEAGLVFTGDHVLPRITPNVGAHPQSTEDPLGDFLDSLDRMRGYGDVLCLPGHEYRFRDLDGRIDELVAHHAERLDRIETLVREGAETVWDVASQLSWSRGWQGLAGFMRRLALTEVEAHLIRLENAGRIRRTADDPRRWVV